jgi:hypothetical protein
MVEIADQHRRFAKVLDGLPWPVALPATRGLRVMTERRESAPSRAGFA